MVSLLSFGLSSPTDNIIMTSHEHHVVSNHVIWLFVYQLIIPTSKKHQSPHYWPFVRGIHRWPLNSAHKGPVMQWELPCDDIKCIMLHAMPMSYCPLSQSITAAGKACSDVVSFTPKHSSKTPQFVCRDKGCLLWVSSQINVSRVPVCNVAYTHIFDHAIGLDWPYMRRLLKIAIHYDILITPHSIKDFSIKTIFPCIGFPLEALDCHDISLSFMIKICISLCHLYIETPPVIMTKKLKYRQIKSTSYFQ